jgi:hypothetical protein
MVTKKRTVKKTEEISITNIKENYHRNGVCGEGFHAINFTVKFGDGTPDAYEGDLIGIYIPKTDEETGEDKNTFSEQCYVVKPTRPDLCYRGDHFEPQIREIVKASMIVWRRQLKESVNNGVRYPEYREFKDMTDVREILNPKPVMIQDPAHRKSRFEMIDLAGA